MTLKFKAGKEYKTRSGKKGYCVGIIPPEFSSPDPVVMVIDDDVMYFKPDGRLYNLPSDYDIVSEWQDKPETLDISDYYQGVCIHDENSISPVTDILSSREKAIDAISRITSLKTPNPHYLGVLKIGTTTITDIHEI